MIKSGNSRAIENALKVDIDLEYTDENGFTALHAAAEIGNTQVVRELLKRGVKVDPIDSSGRTPLSIAVENQHTDVITALISYRANPFETNEQGKTAAELSLDIPEQNISKLFSANTVNSRLKNDNTVLHIAAERGLIPHVNELIAIGADIELKNADGLIPLDMALTGKVTLNKATCAALLLQSGSPAPSDENWQYITEPLRTDDYEIRFETGVSALHKAAEKNQEGMLSLFLSKGAKADIRDQPGNTPLLTAARKGYKTIATLLIENGADVNARDYSGRTPLHEAVYVPNRMELMELLISNGANVNAKDNLGYSPLHHAVLVMDESAVSAVQYLLDNKVEIDARNMEGNTPLMLAVKNDKKDLALMFLARGAGIFQKNNQDITPAVAALRNENNAVSWFFTPEMLFQTDNAGRTILHHALLEASEVAKINTLLAIGSNPNMRDFMGETPLHYAVKYELTNHMEVLLLNGANLFLENNSGISPLILAFERGIPLTLQILEGHLNIEDEWGNTPLFHAISWEDIRIIDALLTEGANPNHRNAQGESPIHRAATVKDINITLRLIEAGALTNIQDILGRTAMHTAAEWGSRAHISLLISRGADINIQDMAGLSPLHIAANKGYSDLCGWLLANGASPNLPDKNGQTPLFTASISGRKRVQQALIASHANISFRDNDGKTALHAAILNKSIDGTITLIDLGADIFAVDSAGQTPFNLLIEAGMEFAKVVITPSIINLQNNQGNTLLHLAVTGKADSGVVEMLLSKGADKSIRNARGKTPYDLADSARNDSLKALLITKTARSSTGNN
ncbi:MAG: hypothetical protein B0D92_00430 [Spirochaeta sp. LUC14_002_19_P3]|nr:MAG: hypothetical protein B0D92_00430 [Spirochaeta sp. LUC14_002_19_P3]